MQGASSPGGSPHAYPGRELEVLAALRAYPRFVLQTLQGGPRGRVLEIGAGMGNLAAHYAQQVNGGVLVEPDAALYARLALRVADGELGALTAAPGTLKEAVAAEPQRFAAAFDDVLLVNVLEHVADDVGLLREAHALLRPGGRLLVYVPALAWLFGSLDTSVGHLRRYDRDGLVDVVTAAGFAVHHVRYADALGVLPWWVMGRVLKTGTFNGGAAGLYDRVGVPLTRVLEAALPVLQRHLGKNLALVAERRA